MRLISSQYGEFHKHKQTKRLIKELELIRKSKFQLYLTVLTTVIVAISSFYLVSVNRGLIVWLLILFVILLSLIFYFEQLKMYLSKSGRQNKPINHLQAIKEFDEDVIFSIITAIEYDSIRKIGHNEENKEISSLKFFDTEVKYHILRAVMILRSHSSCLSHVVNSEHGNISKTRYNSVIQTIKTFIERYEMNINEEYEGHTMKEIMDLLEGIGN